ncbi:MAG TPA: efflux RND transporter periplasmic adaptor subunit [Xanthobacteraceae bacterium]|nr:efflux RND transporter periplasmic adaptor subunit [Xanthobacteraceae bacterium]
MLQRLDTDNLKRTTRGYFRRSRRQVALEIAVVAGAFAIMAALYFGSSGNPQAAVRTEPIAVGSIERTVTALAKVQPKTFVDVGTQVSGQLRQVHVEIGDVVEKGQLLAEIDPTVYQTRVLANRAQVENLKAQLAQSKAQLVLDRAREERSQQLLKTNATSKDAAEAANATVRITEGKIAALKAQIDQTTATLRGDEANLGYTKIHAPMAGTVVHQVAYEGQTVNASQSAPVIVRIADLDTMTVWAQVAEADIPRIKAGMDAYFTTLGMPDKKLEAKVMQVLPTPETVNDVVLYNVLIDVPNKERLLMTNMTAQVFFVLGRAKDVPVVPMAALRPAPRGGDDAYVARVQNGDRVETRRVKIGLSSRQLAEVKEGLKLGERVVIGTAEAPAGQKGPNAIRFRGF